MGANLLVGPGRIPVNSWARKAQAAIHLKSLPESSKNPPKMIQNRRQNGPKSKSGGGLGGSRSLSGRPGRVLGLPGGVLGRLGQVLGRLGRRPGLLGRPGASWGHLGRDFREKWTNIEALHLGWYFLIDF